mmetsp:Transcript_32255/g.36582  ORF Transcript_32255/g.36582 Transcript_32255/m.36582 type:complete len:313 (+) Transcript_32255:61-999(+)
MNPHNQIGNQQQAPQVNEQAQLETKFLGQQPLDRCCCCFDIALSTGVKILAALEIIGGAFSFLALLGIMGNDGDSTELELMDNPPTYLILFIQVVGIYMGTVGWKGASRLDVIPAMRYYKWALFRTIAEVVLKPFQTYAICQRFNDKLEDGDFQEDEEDDLREWNTRDCGHVVRGEFVGNIVGLIIGLYFVWVIFSLAARLQAGQVELCRFGPKINHLGAQYPQANVRNPSVVQGIQLGDVNVYQGQQPQGGFPQGGQHPQGGFPQGGQHPQGGFPQGGQHIAGGQNQFQGVPQGNFQGNPGMNQNLPSGGV